MNCNFEKKNCKNIVENSTKNIVENSGDEKKFDICEKITNMNCESCVIINEEINTLREHEEEWRKVDGVDGVMNDLFYK